MNPDSNAWKRLEEHAAAQLRSGFADRVVRFSQGPDAAAWQQLQDHAASRVRRGFADRVLRAVRGEMPTFFGQMALSAATVAVCLIAVVYMHERSTKLEDQRNLAGWERLASDVQDLSLIQ
jgi:hypothetical protein